MTAEDFFAVIKTFVGLPGPMLAQLESLAPRLTPEARTTAVEELRTEHDAILQESDGILKMVDDGMAELRVAKSAARGAAEAEDRRNADALFSDTDPAAPFLPA